MYLANRVDIAFPLVLLADFSKSLTFSAFLLCEVSSALEEDWEVNSCCSGIVGTASPCTLSRADPIVGTASPCTLSRADLETTREEESPAAMPTFGRTLFALL